MAKRCRHQRRVGGRAHPSTESGSILEIWRRHRTESWKVEIRFEGASSGICRKIRENDPRNRRSEPIRSASAWRGTQLFLWNITTFVTIVPIKEWVVEVSTRPRLPGELLLGQGLRSASMDRIVPSRFSPNDALWHWARRNSHWARSR